MKVGRYILLLLIGGIAGGIIGYLINYLDENNLINKIYFATPHTSLIICIITSLIIIVLAVYLNYVKNKSIQYKRKIDDDINEEEADSFEYKANIYYIRTSLIYYAQITISFIAMFLIVLGKGTASESLFAIIPFLLTSISGVQVGVFGRQFDSRFPKLAEKNAVEKSLSILDEGERHITLVSMYKVYHINLSLIIVGVLVLTLYSMARHSNEMLGLLFLIILFIYNAFGYLFKIYKFYKS